MRIGNGITLLGLALGLAACERGSQLDPRVATASGCQQIEGNEATAEFYKPGQVYAAREVKRHEFVARAIQRERTVGAKLYMHAPRSITGEFLERALTCHALTGRAVHPNDPLHPSEGEIRSVSVSSVGGSFAVQVVADEPQVGREIWARARAFASGSSVDVQQVGAASSGSAL